MTFHCLKQVIFFVSLYRCATGYFEGSNLKIEVTCSPAIKETISCQNHLHSRLLDKQQSNSLSCSLNWSRNLKIACFAIPNLALNLSKNVFCKQLETPTQCERNKQTAWNSWVKVFVGKETVSSYHTIKKISSHIDL